MKSEEVHSFEKRDFEFLTHPKEWEKFTLLKRDFSLFRGLFHFGIFKEWHINPLEWDLTLQILESIKLIQRTNLIHLFCFYFYIQTHYQDKGCKAWLLVSPTFALINITGQEIFYQNLCFEATFKVMCYKTSFLI